MKTAIKGFGKTETVRSSKSRTQSSSESSTKSQASSVSSRKSGTVSPKSSTSNITTTTTSSITRTTAMSPHKFNSIVNKVEALMGKMHNEKLNNFKYLQKQPQNEHNNHHHHHHMKGQNKSACLKCVEERKLVSLDVSQHSTSLDSLANLTDVDSFEGNDTHCTDSDDAEIAHITGTTAVQVHPRRSDLDQLTNGTIREFNGQCFSLGRDSIDMDTEWSAEEDIDIKQQQQQQHPQQQEQQIHNIFNKNKQNQRENNNNNKNNSSSINCQRNDLELCNKTCNETIKNSNQDHHQDKNNKQECNLNLSTATNFVWNATNVDKVKVVNENAVKNHKNTNSNESIGIEEIYGCNRKNYAKIQICQDANKEDSMQNNANGGNSTGKVRRSSTNSNGSVGRMETILEEPSDSKISVREILQRFETMHMSEVRVEFNSIN